VHDLGFKTVTELQWGESVQLGDVKITSRQVKHWGARTFYDQHRGFNAYLLESGKRRVLYGGDTAYFDGFSDIGGVDLAILGIGAYDPYVAAHATPEQAWQMSEHCRAEHVLPMHHSTFRLSHEPVHEPIERLLTAAGRFIDRVVVRQIGGSWALA
jgi:L-ascorbate metabolism protein UlaG (beta-lactamase superfamily)